MQHPNVLSGVQNGLPIEVALALLLVDLLLVYALIPGGLAQLARAVANILPIHLSQCLGPLNGVREAHKAIACTMQDPPSDTCCKVLLDFALSLNRMRVTRRAASAMRRLQRLDAHSRNSEAHKCIASTAACAHGHRCFVKILICSGAQLHLLVPDVSSSHADSVIVQVNAHVSGSPKD